MKKEVILVKISITEEARKRLKIRAAKENKTLIQLLEELSKK